MHPRKPSKVILITGCSSGFGLRMAVRLSAHGHQVFATMRDLNKKTDLLNEAAKRNAKLEVLQLDVTDPVSIGNALAQIQQQAGRLDVLINNAGYALGGFFEDLTSDETRAQLETNFFGVQNVTRAVIPIMRAQSEGRIINISSISGLYALTGLGAYSASKWALEGFSESLFYELKPFNIHVSLIEPGTYRTKIFFENRRYGKNALNPDSPYYQYSLHFKELVDQTVEADRKDPEKIAILAEKLIGDANPPLRNIPDLRSKIILMLKCLLPFRIFSWLIYRALYAGMKKSGGF